MIVFHSLSSCSFPFLVYVRHFLNHTTVLLAPPLALRRLIRLMVVPALIRNNTFDLKLEIDYVKNCWCYRLW